MIAASIERMYFAQYDQVITGVVNGVERAVDPSDHVVNDGQARIGFAMTDIQELVGPAPGEALAYGFLIFRQHIHTEAAAALNAGPGFRSPIGKESGHLEEPLDFGVMGEHGLGMA